MNLNFTIKKVRQLERISINSLKNYCVEGKYRDLVEPSFAELSLLFQLYKSSFQAPIPTLLLPSTVSEVQRKVFFNLYSSSRFPEISTLRGVESWNICPYCGLRNSVTLDHYLPRRLEDFPHFSQFLLNLIPACGDCQQKKGAYSPSQVARRKFWYKRRNGNGGLRRIFAACKKQTRRWTRIGNCNRIIHPYLDFDFDFQRIELNFDFNSIVGPYNFRLSYKSRSRSLQHQLFVFHSAKLALNERLTDPLRKEWATFERYLRALGHNAGSTPEKIRESILALGERSYEKLGEFSMERKFVTAIANRHECIDYLKQLVSRAPVNVLKKKGRRP